MNVNGENLRFIMGFKLKQYRLENGMSLKELGEKTDLSISYLSEIEKGKKYPKPEKILQLARALGVSFDELVSLQVNKDLDPLPVIFSSPVIKEFPFRMFGVSPQDLLALITGDPAKSGAFIRTLLEIGQDYDMRVEHLLLAALRSYQQMNQNYFGEIEAAAEGFLEEMRWSPEPPLDTALIAGFLQEKYRYRFDEETLSGYPELEEARSVLVEGAAPRLLVRDDLQPEQKKFILAREIGYRYLNLKERSLSSAWMNVASFDQIVNDFKASYFAGALLMSRELLCRDLAQFLRRPRWDGAALLEMIERYQVTPEMFLYRASELLPQFFGLKDFMFFRFTNGRGSHFFELAKLFNMSRISIPNGIGAREHYCRRWMALKLLAALKEQQQNGTYDGKPLIGVQRSRFIDHGVETFGITLARPSSVEKHANASGTISFVINEHFKNTVAFWNDPEIPVVEVNETCERCSLPPEMCRERAVPPGIYEKQQQANRQEKVLKELIERMAGEGK